MVLMIVNLAELDQLAQALPFQVLLDRDKDQIEFPVYVKAVQVSQMNAAGEDEDVVLLVTMTQVELAEVTERRTDKIAERMMHGYDYAEADEGTDTADSGEIEVIGEYTSDDYLQNPLFSDDDFEHRAGEASGREEFARETDRGE